MQIVTDHSRDLVYACALATIIVATGASAEAGLPGVKDLRSISQRKIDIGNGYHLMETVAQGNANHLQHSSWNSRGWTFQERLLSRRALIVTPEQFYVSTALERQNPHPDIGFLVGMRA